MKILVVDGNVKSRERLKKILVKGGHEVITASDGIDGFHKYEENEIRMAFIDWTMPKMNGTELCLRIRDYNLKTGRVSYLVLVSAKTAKHDMVEGLDSGADDFVMKPYSESVINSRVQIAGRMLETKFNRIPKVEPLKDKVIEPIARLNREHEMVHNITAVLEMVANMLGDGMPLPKKMLEWSASSAFMLNWQLHEEKEQYYIDLFVVRAQDIHGKTAQLFSRSSLNKILREHDMIKQLLEEMQAAAKAYNIDNRASVFRLRQLILRYLPLIRFHAAREEDVFLPFSQRYLTDEDVSRILRDFRRIDDEIGQDTIKERAETVEQLLRTLKIKEKAV
ncbi:MAG: response regulator [Thermoplasmata archaeon]|nr:response regulator [Thermoplasmata archaeon]